jgi:hypothetical protein
MKIKPKDQRIINEFARNYVNSSYKMTLNAVRLSADHTDAHRRAIFEVCNSLLEVGIPFFTEVHLLCGCIPDIVAPTHVTPFIEVLCTETPEMFEDLKLHRYPIEFQTRYNSGRLKSFTLVNALAPFNKELLF